MEPTNEAISGRSDTVDLEAVNRSLSAAVSELMAELSKADAEIERLLQLLGHEGQLSEEITRLRAEVERLKTSGISEVAAHSPSMMDYMLYWESRAGKAEAEVERLRAALQWRPIETAPRDGTWIVVSAPKIEPETACWAQSVWIKGWYTGGSRSDSYGPSFGPTHWMPLPPPPEIARAALEGKP